MSLSKWDKEIGQITQELFSTKKLINKISNDSLKQINKISVSSEALHNQLNDNLEKIMYLSNPTEMLKPHELSLFYWATKYAEKAQTYLKKFQEKSMYSMWIKLINRRTLGLNTVSEISNSIGNISDGIPYLKSKNNQQEKSRLLAIREIETTEDKKNKLTEKYNHLVLVRANKDAVSSFKINFSNESFNALTDTRVLALENFIKTASTNNYNASILTFIKENRKMNHLVCKPITHNNITTPSAELKTVDSAINPDTLGQLAQKMMELNHKEDAVPEKLSKKDLSLNISSKKKRRKKVAAVQNNSPQPVISDFKLTEDINLEEANKFAIEHSEMNFIGLKNIDKIAPSGLKALQ